MVVAIIKMSLANCIWYNASLACQGTKYSLPLHIELCQFEFDYGVLNCGTEPLETWFFFKMILDI